MKKIILDDIVYDKVFLTDNDEIIKISTLTTSIYDKLKSKNLEFLNLPTQYRNLTNVEKKKYNNCKTMIYLPYLKNFKTLFETNFIHTFDTKDVLLLLRKMLINLKAMHEKNVFHGDLFSKNIMINDSLDYSFIDLDAAIVDEIISPENIFANDKISFEDKKLFTAREDKIGIFNLFLYFFLNKNFRVEVSYDVEFEKLGLPKMLYDEIKYSVSRKKLDLDYYFIDIVDELLDIGYEPKLLKLH